MSNQCCSKWAKCIEDGAVILDMDDTGQKTANVNGCCGQCYVLMDLLYCPYCGQPLNTDEESQINQEVIPPGQRRSVLQDWVHALTFMQQSVLIASVRGPDGIRKDHPVKVLYRYLRRCFLISAFDRKAIWDPYAPGGGSFTGPCSTDEVGSLAEAQELYLRHVDEIPHHAQLHLMHAAEILGYKHPEHGTRHWWNNFYNVVVNDAHLHPETEAEMDKRLGDNEDDWRAREEVTAK